MKLNARLRQTLDAWASEGRPWMGYLLLGSIALVVIGFLVLVATGLIILGVVGGREGDGGAGKAFAQGTPMALLWLFAMLLVVGLSLAYVWWSFARGNKPPAIHGDLKAAQGGDALAAHRLGQHYRHRDPGSARAWFAQAAHAGVPEAMVDLAQDLREGRGGPRDLASAREWLHRASLSGEPRAAALLAEVDAQIGDRHSERGI